MYIKGQAIKILTEFLNLGPFKGKKFPFMGRLVGFSLCQTPTGIGYDSISPIITSLVENRSQARPTGVGMELEMPLKIG